MLYYISRYRFTVWESVCTHSRHQSTLIYKVVYVDLYCVNTFYTYTYSILYTHASFTLLKLRAGMIPMLQIAKVSQQLLLNLNKAAMEILETKKKHFNTSRDKWVILSGTLSLEQITRILLFSNIKHLCANITKSNIYVDEVLSPIPLLIIIKNGAENWLSNIIYKLKYLLTIFFVPLLNKLYN